MSTLPAPNDSGNFEPVPEGTHLALCYRVIDLGTQQSSYQGAPRRTHKVLVSWEIPGELMSNGDPYTIHQRYTWSMSEKALLRQHLESWRGKKFTESDFGPQGFNIKNLLGIACLLTVVHEKKDGKTYSNIGSISKLMKGMETPPAFNTPIYLWLTPPIDPNVLALLSQGLQETIRKSPEYSEATKTKAPHFEPVSDEPPPVGSVDDYGAEASPF